MTRAKAVTVLVVTEDRGVYETLTEHLRRDGYQVCATTEGHSALALAHREQPDLVLLDLMLPHAEGLDVCRRLRSAMTMPILLLSERDRELDLVVGLELGADAYVTKPIPMRALLARVKALLRRAAMPPVQGARWQDEIMVGDIVLDRSARCLRRGPTEITLTTKEYKLLDLLMTHTGQVLGRTLLLETVWGTREQGTNRTLDVHVRWLRAKIEPDPCHPRYIVTIRRIGYRFDGAPH